MKTCCRCGIEKRLEDFNRASKSRENDGRQSHCRECSSAYYRNNSVRHKQNVRRRNRRQREILKAIVIDHLKSHPCVDCGEHDLVVLDFDHVRGVKSESIANLANGYGTAEKLLTEIAKCDVRCANCHRRKTAKQLGWKRRRGPNG